MSRPSRSESGSAVTRARGFVYYDLWITIAVIALAAWIVVPGVLRAVRMARLRRQEIGVLRQIAAAEAVHRDSTHIFLDSLPVALPTGVTLLGLHGDSTGWGAAVVADSGRRTQVRCGVFEGTPSHTPDPAVTSGGRIVCW